MRPRLILTAAIAAGTMTACYNIGPNTIPRDRFDYNAAISDSWKEQTLLNIVKVRYADMPLFVDIASVVSGYSLESSVNLSVVEGTRSNTNRDSSAIGGSATYTDRPTITYAPITGDKFNKSFMTPIPPRVVLFLVQSGWPVDRIFPLTVDSINGMRSQISTGSSSRGGDEDYYRAIELMRDIQLSGGTGMQIVRDDDDVETAVLIIHKEALSARKFAEYEELANLLGVDPADTELTIRYGYLPRAGTEVAMITRSMLQVIIYLAGQMEVPADHIATGRTMATSFHASRTSARQLIRIQSSAEEPEDAFVAVRYRDTWYSIDDGDMDSKGIFTFVMILMSLTESGNNAGLPLVTIPAG